MSESLAELFFPTLYNKAKSDGEKIPSETVSIMRDGLIFSTGFGAAAWERLQERDPETGEPVGYLAVKRDQVAQRLQKMFFPRYGRRLQFA